MTLSPTPFRRSAAEWGLRLGLAIGAAAFGIVAVAQSLAYTMRVSAVEQAHVLAPNDGRITALASQRLGEASATPAERIRADNLARQALRQDPTAIEAVSTLMLDAQARNDTAGARRLFAYSNLLSRRDFASRSWAIDDAVARGDIWEALRHYDIALRTSSTAPNTLFPILASAIAEPAIRDNLVRTLMASPAWGDSFVMYTAGKGSNTRAAALLFAALHKHRVVLPSEATAILIGRLLADNHPEDAWSYYAAITPGVDRHMSRDPDFMADKTTPSAFDWLPVADSGIAATIQHVSHGGVFDFAAPSNVGGPLLQQVQMLPAGTYVLEGRSKGIDQPDAARPYWTLSCAGQRELGRIDMPNSAQDNGRFRGRFVVPANCPLQHLLLVARPSEQLSGAEGQITHARLHLEAR